MKNYPACKELTSKLASPKDPGVEGILNFVLIFMYCHTLGMRASSEFGTCHIAVVIC